MRAIVVRHYKTTSNESEQILGWGDAPPAASWQDDLNKVGEILMSSQVTIHQIYTSTLPRAINTGKFYADNYGIGDIYSSPAIREINYGKLYNKKKKWAEKHIPQHKVDPDFVYPDGESFSEMQKRSVSFIDSLAQDHPDETLLIVVHAGVIRGLICHYLELDYASNLKRHMGHQYIGDFTLEGDNCVRYDELGKPSEFVREDVIKIPLYRFEPRSGTKD